MPIVHELAVVKATNDREITRLIELGWQPFGLTSTRLALRREGHMSASYQQIMQSQDEDGHSVYWTVQETPDGTAE